MCRMLLRLLRLVLREVQVNTAVNAKVCEKEPLPPTFHPCSGWSDGVKTFGKQRFIFPRGSSTRSSRWLSALSGSVPQMILVSHIPEFFNIIKWRLLLDILQVLQFLFYSK